LAESESSDWQFQVGVDQAIEQTRDLFDQGIPGLHLYVLNRSNATAKILGALDVLNQS
jgi:methylenetetrahydrofolate reductase (NADPH)